MTGQPISRSLATRTRAATTSSIFQSKCSVRDHICDKVVVRLHVFSLMRFQNGMVYESPTIHKSESKINHSHHCRSIAFNVGI